MANIKNLKTWLVVSFVLVWGVVTEQAKAVFTFGTPTNLGRMVNSTSKDYLPSISLDGLSLYFASNRPGGYGNFDLWVTRRATTKDEWGEPVNLGPTVNTSGMDTSPAISADGLSLYFDGDRPGGYGAYDIWVATRETKQDAWGEPVNLGRTVNTSVLEFGPSISADGLELYFSHGQAWEIEIEKLIWLATRASVSDQWGSPVMLGPAVNAYGSAVAPSVSSDGLVMFFGSLRAGGSGSHDLWMSRRNTPGETWGAAVNLGRTVNSGFWEADPDISTDGLTLYFSDHQVPLPGGVGGGDMWQVPVIPIVDFNGDGFVNAEDMNIMAYYWGENYSLCDIGPMPWGDGIVDVHDLNVLEEHLFEEFLPPSLIAYWKLDETEGVVIYDSIGHNDGSLFGDPVWRPAEGNRDGALEFDGIDDHAIVLSVLNLPDGPFSVFACIKGGAPGQVVISQIGGGVNWLLADPIEGNLMTELKESGRSGKPLQSQTNITDGNWHGIGFVWDGSYRSLYVDGVEVAKDVVAQPPLQSATGGLYIGANKILDAASFFSGLIDDVRIYNRPVSAVEIEGMAYMGVAAAPEASGPYPLDGALHQDTWVNLRWFAGSSAVSHNVYFGDNFDDVDAGTGDTFQGNQTATSFRVGSTRSPSLVPGTTYYWRVDEINDLHPDSPWKGDLWNFTLPGTIITDLQGLVRLR